MIPSKRRPMSGTRGVSLVARAGISALVPRDPPYLILFVTHRCNARCPFCFNRDNQEKAKDSGPELSLSEVERMAANWRGIIQVTLTGGEPFLRPDLADIARAWAKAGAQSITIATNGIMTDRIAETAGAILEFSPGIFLDLDLSIDGPEEEHDRLRGVAGAHRKVMETAKRLSPLQDQYPGFRVGASVTVSGFNQTQAPETVRELMDSGLFQRVQALLIRGRPFDSSALECDLSAYESCSEALLERRMARGAGQVREALSARVREVVAETVREKRMVLACRAGRTMVTVDPYGHVYPCEMLGQLFPDGDPERGIGTWVMGSLPETGYSVREVMRSDQARQVRSWIRKTNCYCSFECAAYNNIVFNPGQWPGIIKRIVKG